MLKVAMQVGTAALIVGVGAWIAPSTAQFQQFPGGPPEFPAPPSGEPEDQPPAAPKATPKQKKAGPPAGPNVAGNWAGQLTQVGSTAPYKFEITIGGRLETKYPDLGCTGKLTRIGSSRSYVFFIEIITQGQADKGGRCPDGTITVARQGDKLALGWFGSIQGETVVAYGTLSKK